MLLITAEMLSLHLRADARNRQASRGSSREEMSIIVWPLKDALRTFQPLLFSLLFSISFPCCAFPELQLSKKSHYQNVKAITVSLSLNIFSPPKYTHTKNVTMALLF